MAPKPSSADAPAALTKRQQRNKARFEAWRSKAKEPSASAAAEATTAAAPHKPKLQPARSVSKASRATKREPTTAPTGSKTGKKATKRDPTTTKLEPKPTKREPTATAEATATLVAPHIAAAAALPAELRTMQLEAIALTAAAAQPPTPANHMERLQTERRRKRAPRAAAKAAAPPMPQQVRAEPRPGEGTGTVSTAATPLTAVPAMPGAPRKRVKLDTDSQYRLTKRVPQRLATLENDIYVSMRSNFIALVKRAQQLLNGDRFDKVTVHGLGAAVVRAIDVALAVQRHGLGLIELHVTTDTVPLVDDLDPTDQDEMPITQERFNSCVHITVSKRLPLQRPAP